MIDWQLRELSYNYSTVFFPFRTLSVEFQITNVFERKETCEGVELKKSDDECDEEKIKIIPLKN